MVEVITKTTPQTTANPSNLIDWVFQNILILIFVALIIALIIGIYVMWQKWKEDQKKRDHPIYEAYCNIMDSCKLNANTLWIDKKYSFLNLLWFGIPLVWREHSAKIRNKDDEVLGWYRGHFYSQDGYLNISLYKTKKFFIMENTFILRCPINIVYKTKTGINPDGSVKYQTNRLNFRDYIKYQPNKDIKIQCYAFESYSYYTYPVYIGAFDAPVDLRQIVGENVIELGQGQMLTRVFEDGARMARKAMEHNPSVNAERLKPEKIKEDSGNDGGS